MSDTTAGDIQDARGVAVGEGASAQQVNVTVQATEPATMRDWMRAMWTMQLTDQQERRERQRETDGRFSAIHERLDRLEQLVVRLVDIRRWLYALGAPGVAALIVALYEVGLRLRWW